MIDNNFFGIAKQSDLIRGNTVVVSHTLKYFLPNITTTGYADPPYSDIVLNLTSTAELPPDEVIFDVFYIAPRDMTLISATVCDSKYLLLSDVDYELRRFKPGDVVYPPFPAPGEPLTGGQLMGEVTITTTDTNKTVDVELVDSISDSLDTSIYDVESRFLQKGDRVGLFPKGSGVGISTDFGTLVVTLLFKEL